jgi:hypothetical protein
MMVDLVNTWTIIYNFLQTLPISFYLGVLIGCVIYVIIYKSTHPKNKKLIYDIHIHDKFSNEEEVPKERTFTDLVTNPETAKQLSKALWPRSGKVVHVTYGAKKYRIVEVCSKR